VGEDTYTGARLSAELELSAESLDAPPPPGEDDGEEEGSTCSDITPPPQQSNAAPEPMPSPSLIIGRPELTWSTEFSTLTSHRPPSPAVHQRSNHRINKRTTAADATQSSGDNDLLSISIEYLRDVDDSFPLKQSAPKTTQVLTTSSDIEDSHKENHANEVTGGAVASPSPPFTTLLQGLRRKNSPSAIKPTHPTHSPSHGKEDGCSGSTGEDVQLGSHTSPRKKAPRSRHQGTPPRDGRLRIPGNHLDLRQVGADTEDCACLNYQLLYDVVCSCLMYNIITSASYCACRFRSVCSSNDCLIRIACFFPLQSLQLAQIGTGLEN
jgi:hypothetical protein